MTDDLIGKKIGGYEILELIGHGGMATVYRAQQVSMNRVVAVKILPRQFLNDETYMQRFNREVKIVAQLEHRNIVPVHDYGEEDGQPYIVMRYMSGGSVDDLLRDGALDLERIVSIISQIAPALDYAHGKNVLHRDLKPSNILMDDDGGAYLTDFGIARLMSEVSNVTITTHGVVGTPSYMSPEQAQGQPLDNRSDIYSLGVTVFEMATGKRPFEGDTPYSIAVLQVTAPPPAPRSLNPNVPVPVEDVILKALSKNRENRYGHAVQLASVLKDAAERKRNMSDTQPGFPRPQLPPKQPDVNETAESVVSTPPPDSSVFTPPPPASSYVIPPVSVRSRLAPRRKGGNLLISVVIGGVLGCGLLALLGVISFFVISSIMRGNATPTPAIPGGLASPLPATNTSSPLTRGTAIREATETHAVTAAPTRAATEVSAVGIRPTLPALTNGSVVYFAERDGDYDIYRLDLQTRFETQLTDSVSSELYPAVSPDGTKIAFMSDRDGDYDIYVMNADGSSTRRLTTNNITDRAPAWSPDGDWIAFSSDMRGDGSHDLYRMRADGSDQSRLYSDGNRNSDPLWSADSASIYFTGGSISDAGTWEIKRLDVASGEVTALTTNDVKDWSPRFAPDGGLIYLTEGDGHAAIARMDADADNQSTFYDDTGYEWGVSYSPSGDLITFNSDTSGRDEIYLMNADGTNVREVTDLGGMFAAWLPDAKP